MKRLLPAFALLFALTIRINAYEGPDYFVSPSGNDASGDGSLAKPWKTIQKCISYPVAGGSCQIRGGTYNGFVNIGEGFSHSGASFDRPITLKPYNHEPVVLRNSGEVTVVGVHGDSNYDLYWIVDEITLDGANGYQCCAGAGLITGSGRHLRFQNGRVINGLGGGLLGDGTYWELINEEFANNGRDRANGSHAVYWSGKHLLIDGGSYHDNNNGFGIHIFHTGSIDVDDNVVRNTRIYNNGNDGFCQGLILSTGHRNMAYNNLIYSNGPSGEVQVDYRAVDTALYNNTIVPNPGGYGIKLMNDGGDSTGTIIRNNIIYLNVAERAIVDHSAGGTVDSNNLKFTNPRFVNAANRDFRLMPMSPAAGKGADLSALGIPELMRDFAGRARPKGAAWDIGALQLERAATVVH